MMNKNWTHRILPIYVYHDMDEFIYDANLDLQKVGPCFILIDKVLYGYSMVFGYKELMFTNIKVLDKKKVVISDKVKYVEYLDDLDISKLNNFDVVYCVSNRQLYEFYHGKLDRGVMIVYKGNVMQYEDVIDIKLEKINTTSEMVKSCFEPFDLDSCFDENGFSFSKMADVNPKLIFNGNRIIYCRENETIYAILDSDNLNALYTNCKELTKQDNDIHKYENCVSRSGRLFHNGKRVDTLNFTYGDAIYNFRFMV